MQQAARVRYTFMQEDASPPATLKARGFFACKNHAQRTPSKPSFEVTFRWTVTGGAKRRKIEWLAEPQFQH